MESKLIYKRIASVSGNVYRLSETLNTMERTSVPDSFDDYAKLSLHAAQEGEWIALRLRHLAYDTALINRSDYMPKAVESLGIKIQEIDGIYEIILPGLMPKRRARLGPEFVVDPLMYALDQYIKTHRVKRYPHTTVCFVLVYDRNLPTRRIRDYDNLELKPILDAAAIYLMDSDAGLLCDTYHTTELGDTDCMRMYIMDSKRYPEWYVQRQATLEDAKNQG